MTRQNRLHDIDGRVWVLPISRLSYFILRRAISTATVIATDGLDEQR